MNRKRVIVALVAFAGLAAGWPGAARALQPAGGAPPAAGGAATPAERAALPAAELEAFAGDALERLALIDLRAQPEAVPGDYRVALALGAIAQTMVPRDAELLRRRIEAAFAAGESELARAMCRDLVSLDPADTWALLAVISGRISALQTAEERLAAYERFIGPEGSSIDDSVRSRLALDAALLRRERGDEAGFASTLRRALTLDQTNKEAAVLAATLFGGADADLTARFELLSNLLLADPLDGETHLGLSRLLTEAGAFKGARRFGRHAGLLLPSFDSEESIDFVSARLVLQWQTDGTAPVLADLQRELAVQREQAAANIKRYEETRTGLELERPDLVNPEDVRLHPKIDNIRMLSADAQGDTEIRDQAITDLGRSIDALIGRLSDPAQRVQGMDDAEAQRQMFRARVDMWITRAAFGVGMDAAGEARAAMDADPGKDEDRLALLDAHLALHAGDFEKARSILAPRAAGELVAQAGMVLLHERAGEQPELEAALVDLARRAPERPLGAWARTKLASLRGRQDPLRAESEALETAASSVPSWVDRMIDSPRSFIGLNARIRERTLHATRPAEVVVTIRNVSPVPMSFGPDGTISSAVIVSSAASAGSAQLGVAEPELSMGSRRLRLRPGQSVEIPIEPESGLTGWIVGSAADRTVRQRWRVIQGFVERGGLIDAGPLSLTTQTESLVRPALEEAALSAADLAGRIREAGGGSLPSLLLASRARLLASGAPGLDEVASAWVDRYARATRAEKLAILATLPNAGLAPAMAPLDRAALAERDPDVWIVAMVSRAASADEGAVVAAASAGGPPGEIASVLIDRTARGGVLLGAGWPRPAGAGR